MCIISFQTRAWQMSCLLLRVTRKYSITVNARRYKFSTFSHDSAIFMFYTELATTLVLMTAFQRHMDVWYVRLTQRKCFCLFEIRSKKNVFYVIIIVLYLPAIKHEERGPQTQSVGVVLQQWPVGKCHRIERCVNAHIWAVSARFQRR